MAVRAVGRGIRFEGSILHRDNNPRNIDDPQLAKLFSDGSLVAHGGVSEANQARTKLHEARTMSKGRDSGDFSLNTTTRCTKNKPFCS
jgi:hypothetical protein